MPQILVILEFYIKNYLWKPLETGGSGGNEIFKTLNFGQILDDFDMKSFPISKICFLLTYLSHMPYWSTIDFVSITETLRGRQDFDKGAKITHFSLRTQMALPQPYFWPQSQTSYGRMLTRLGRFDFATKFKITLQSLILGFGPFCRATLLNTCC